PAAAPPPPPPPSVSRAAVPLQANTEPPKLSREEQRGRGALLQDICKGTKLRKVTQINDRSAPILESECPEGSCSRPQASRASQQQPPSGRCRQQPGLPTGTAAHAETLPA
uniref:WH2 domain-containing protein n=1 Tax=Malurus cyaneus samueli TaxID=2593467 RepID=A0A8C5U5S1_9PASS